MLIVDDPDAPDPKAPKMTYVHWVLFDLPTRYDRDRRGHGRAAATEPRAASTTGNVPATAGRARPSAATAISSSSTRSMPGSKGCRRRPRPMCSRPCRATYWRRHKSSAPIRRPARHIPNAKNIGRRYRPARGPVGACKDSPRGFVDAKTLIPDLIVEMRYATAHNFVGRPIPATRHRAAS